MKEEDIRPRTVFNEYLRLVEKDIPLLFEFSGFEQRRCPACNNDQLSFEFEKSRFTYVSCSRCRTLFVNPRPPFEALNAFYGRSASSSYWVNAFFKPVAEIRREKIFRPRARHISTLLPADTTWTIGDIGAGFGLFLEELRAISPSHRYIAIEPSGEMADICSSNGLEVRCSPIEELRGHDGVFDLLTAFELFEHLHEPRTFLQKANMLLREGGYLYLTTLNGKGFDIQMLWERSKSITPPHHLNFFNPASAALLLENAGFEVVESSTPGALDWDIVEGAYRNESAEIGRFWKMVADNGSPTAKSDLQEWLVNNKFSSHMAILAKKVRSMPCTMTVPKQHMKE